MTEYDKGRVDALNYVVSEGKKILETGYVPDKATRFGMSMIMGVAHVKRREIEKDDRDN